MSLASKLSAGLLAAACVCSLAAAEIINLNEPADFLDQQAKPAKNVSKSEDGLAVKGPYFVLLSAKTVTLDPAKKYKISADYRLKEGEESGSFFLGFAPLDANDKSITSVSVNIVKDTDTIVAKDAKAGDSVVYVKDASKWQTNTPHGYITFNTKVDFSDLPNRDYVGIPENGINQDGDVWAVTLKTPLKKDVAAGTCVRQQKAGSSYVYAYYRKKMAPQEWITGSGVVSGEVTKFGLPNKKLWAGTASVRVLVMMLDGKKGNVIEFKNLKVEEIE